MTTSHQDRELRAIIHRGRRVAFVARHSKTRSRRFVVVREGGTDIVVPEQAVRAMRDALSIYLGEPPR